LAYSMLSNYKSDFRVLMSGTTKVSIDFKMMIHVLLHGKQSD
jgi:hypothetical protein